MASIKWDGSSHVRSQEHRLSGPSPQRPLGQASSAARHPADGDLSFRQEIANLQAMTQALADLPLGVSRVASLIPPAPAGVSCQLLQADRLCRRRLSEAEPRLRRARRPCTDHLRGQRRPVLMAGGQGDNRRVRRGASRQGPAPCSQVPRVAVVTCMPEDRWIRRASRCLRQQGQVRVSVGRDPVTARYRT
jgi:hypothetical protein